ncbi:hypothetical protein E5D57_010647 [Metarhizium anisopliae]|nr:hypothetical protein E5D57_010647 [Metarhizium anisopliae]
MIILIQQRPHILQKLQSLDTQANALKPTLGYHKGHPFILKPIHCSSNLQLIVILIFLLLGLLSLFLLLLLLRLLRSGRGSFLGALLLERDGGAVLALLLDEFNQTLNSTGTIVGNGAVLIASGEELDVNLALVLLGDGLEVLGEAVALLLGLSEDVGEGNTSGHVVSIGLRANLSDERSGSSLGKFLNGLSVKLLSVGVLALVEGLVQNNRGELDTLGFGNSSLVDTAEQIVVTELLGNSGEGLVGGLVIGSKVGDDNNLVGRLELLEGILGQERNGRQRLLDHVRGDGSSLALAIVGGDIVNAAENLEGGITLDAVLLAEFSFFSAVNLGELDVLFFQSGSSLLVFGGEGFAVSAPRGED